MLKIGFAGIVAGLLVVFFGDFLIKLGIILAAAGGLLIAYAAWIK